MSLSGAFFLGYLACSLCVAVGLLAGTIITAILKKRKKNVNEANDNEKK